MSCSSNKHKMNKIQQLTIKEKPQVFTTDKLGNELKDKNGKSYSRVLFRVEELPNTISSLVYGDKNVLLTAEAGQQVLGTISTVEKNGVVYYNFSIANRDDMWKEEIEERLSRLEKSISGELPTIDEGISPDDL